MKTKKEIPKIIERQRIELLEEGEKQGQIKALKKVLEIINKGDWIENTDEPSDPYLREIIEQELKELEK